MRAASCLLAVALLFVEWAYAAAPGSYPAAKRLLSDIHEDVGHRVTLYGGCPYERVGDSGGDINSEPCGHETRTDETRSGLVEWERVTPASWFGAYRPCWKGYERFVRMSGKDKGKLYAKRKCCYKQGVDPEFRAPFVDLHNLFPTDGELNNDHGDSAYGTAPGSLVSMGRATSRLVAHPRSLNPTDGVRDELDRAMLYMAGQHGAHLEMEREALLVWP